jgi:nucleoside-diphosphate-sugar epimerase
MRILVTGGAGYIGSILVPHLLRTGHEVCVLDSFMYGQAPLLDHLMDGSLEIVRGDARDESLLKRLVPAADALIPLACLTGAPLCDRDPSGARTVIVDAVDSLLRLTSADQQIVYPTTNSGYGIGEAGAYCTEETPLRPVSLYGRLKAEAEARLLDSGRAVTLRLATAFGASPRMRLDLLVNDFTYRAVTDRFIVLFQAHFKRNFVHVRDIARVFVHVLERGTDLRGQVYNVGLDAANMTKRELCETIQRQVPELWFTEADVGADPDLRDYVVSSAKLYATGFRPLYSLEQGIAELVRAYAVLRQSAYSNV